MVKKEIVQTAELDMKVHTIKNEIMNIIFHINGGIGKCIVATAVCSAIKKKHKNADLIVISGYPEVFINNPNVKKSFAFGQTAYFYQDYIENKKFQVLMHDPYLTTDYVQKSKHLAEIWCDLYGIPYKGELPEFFMTQREIDNFQKQVAVDKPIFLIQSNGGGDTNKKYSWARDIPSCVMEGVINEFREDYAIVHVRRDDQMSYPHTHQLTAASLRMILAIAMLSEKRLVMDSFLQHGLAALNLPSVALWVANTPKVFGYDIHTHIVANPFTTQPELRNSFLEKFRIDGDELEFPYNSESEIFDTDKVIKSLKDLKNTHKIKKPDGRISLPNKIKLL